MKKLFDFFRVRGGGLVASRSALGVFAAAAGLAGLLVLMSCSDEEEERERIGRVISVECGPPEEGAGEDQHVDLYFLTENRHGVLSCAGLNMVLDVGEGRASASMMGRGQQGGPQAASMRLNVRLPSGEIFSPYKIEGWRAQNRHRHEDGTCGRRIYAFTQHLQEQDGVRWSPGVYYVEEHPDVIESDAEDKDEFIGFWVGTPDEFDSQTNEGLLCPTYMKMDPGNRNTPGGDLDEVNLRIPCTEEVRTKMNGRDSCLLVNDFGFPEHRTLRFDWDAALAPSESQ